MFMLKTDEKNIKLHRVQKMDKNGNIVFRPHFYAGEASKNRVKPLMISKKAQGVIGHKITVDPIGRIFPAND